MNEDDIFKLKTGLPYPKSHYHIHHCKTCGHTKYVEKRPEEMGKEQARKALLGFARHYKEEEK